MTALGKDMHCVEVMSIDQVFCFLTILFSSLLTCYGCLVRTWMKLAFGRSSTTDRFYWKLYSEPFQLGFQWRGNYHDGRVSLQLWQTFISVSLLTQPQTGRMRKGCEIESCFSYSKDIKMVFTIIVGLGSIFYCISTLFFK